VEHDFPFIGNRILLLNARRIPAPPKEAQWILLAFEDVTEHMESDRTLRASEQRFRRAFETAMDGMLLIEKTSGMIVNSNKSVEDSLGYSKQSLRKKTLWELGLFKDEEQFRQTALELEEHGMVGLPDISIPIRRGGHFPADVYLMDRAAVFQCNIREISERRKAEEYSRKLAAIVDSSEDAIIGKTLNGTIISWNQGAEKIYGYTADEIIGKPISILAPNGQKKEFIQILHEIERGEAVAHYETKRRVKNGQIIHVSLTVSPIKGENGKIVGASTIARDISERKRAEEQLIEYSTHLEEMVDDRTRELRQAQEQLVRKEKLAVLGQLAGGVGHELRNPLGVISNSIYYLKLVQPEADEKIKQHLAMIEQEVQNAAKIVGDLLDYARIISTDRRPESITNLVQNALSRFPVPASIQVRLKIPDELPQVYVDPLHIEQVLGNLITNACQAMTAPSLKQLAGAASSSGSGKLTITASALVPVSATRPESSTGWDRQKQMLAISVKDTGTGITPENMEKLFEALFTTKTQGIGLGLAVSQKLTAANGGRIEAQSEPGKGSMFTVYLPTQDG
jgi:PAS domain S-box-containing protein